MTTDDSTIKNAQICSGFDLPLDGDKEASGQIQPHGQ